MTDTRKNLIAELRRAHAGEPWHGPSRASVLEGITAKQAAWQPGAGAHSIWELVLHMRAWTLEVLRRANGAAPAEPEEGDWPAVPAETTEAEWTKAKQRLDEAHAALIAGIEALPADGLEQRVGTGSGKGISCRAMLYSLAQHDIYHTGQVALLKRLAAAGTA